MQKRKSIAIYGTGIDGRRLHRIIRNKINRKIVCFLDTDIKYNNSIFFKIPVIQPSHNRDFLNALDEIYLGGRYMNDQEKYLKKLKFKGKIIKTDRWEYKYPKKDIIKREVVLLKILKKLLSIFKKNEIDYIIDASSLLAISRGQKLAEFTDIDIAIKSENTNLKKLIKMIRKQDTYSYKSFIFHKKKHFLFKKGSFLQCVLTSKCNSYIREPVNIEFYTENKLNKNYHRFVSPNLISIIPEKYRNQTKIKKYSNITLNIPKDTDGYLILLYGKDWKKKNQNWKNTDSKRFKLYSSFK